MIDWTTIPFICKNCKSHTDILIDIENEKDYIFNSECCECGTPIPQPLLDRVPDAVINYIVGKAEYHCSKD